jgi:radical SAM superfamily enzyme with C-terminal helix-hairpin-helix motif
MATKWYRYMVSYKFNNGSGRVFIDRFGAPIDTAEAVEEIEAGIRERSPHLGPLHADNIVLLKEWSE